jgi:dynactin complex subunit
MQKWEAERKATQEERKKQLEKLFAEKKALETRINETVKKLENLKQSKDDIRSKQENSIAKITEEVFSSFPTML